MTSFNGWADSWGNSWGDTVVNPNDMRGNGVINFAASLRVATGQMQGAALFSMSASLQLVSPPHSWLIEIGLRATKDKPSKKVQTVHHKPIRSRILEAAKKRYRQAQTQSKRPEQAIEQQAAKAVLDGDSDTQFNYLMAQWRSYKQPSLNRSDADLTGLFVAQVAFEVQRLQRLKLEIDDEEAVLALMLA